MTFKNLIDKHFNNVVYHHAHSLGIRLRHKQRQLELKGQCLKHYGNDKIACVLCGFDDMRALSIDHIQGNGAEHRRLINNRRGAPFYRWLKNNGYPDGYQTLCMNCQYIKRYTNGENN